MPDPVLEENQRRPTYPIVYNVVLEVSVMVSSIVLNSAALGNIFMESATLM